MEPQTFTLTGHGGTLVAYRWQDRTPTYIVLLCHGYGEHMGRYLDTAADFVRDGAVVYGLDHYGHGRSEGDRVNFSSFDAVVDDFHLLEERARLDFPDLPVAFVGHSMGGMMAVRYGQRYGSDLACIVLSAPVIGKWAPLESYDPDAEIDPIPLDSLSRIEAVQTAYADDPLVWHGGFKPQMVGALSEGLDEINKSGTLPVPTLWIQGSDDSLVPYDGTAYGWEIVKPEEGEHVVLDGSRHEVFNDLDRDKAIGHAIEFIHRYISVD